VTRLSAIRAFVSVTKPLIVFGNLVTATGGFLFACGGRIDARLLAATVTGIGLVVAAACVANNCIDRRIDGRMDRTRRRAMVRGRLSLPTAVAYAALLGLGGLGLLAAVAHPLTPMLALAGFGIYVFLYSLWLKPRSVHATLVGSLAGAAPALAGYCAVSGRFDARALMLLLVMCLWQVPHSYAIAVSRMADYAAAQLPVLPVACGLAAARRHIAVFIAAFTLATAMLTVAGIASVRFMAVNVGMGLAWLLMATAVKTHEDHQCWGRRLYITSIVTLTLFCITLSIETLKG
jgi:protoheme IX farnesyltransferase